MLPERVSNPGPLTYESGALPIALRGPAANSNGSGRNARMLGLIIAIAGRIYVYHRSLFTQSLARTLKPLEENFFFCIY